MRDFVRAWDKVMMLDRFEVRVTSGEGALQERPHRSGFAGPSRPTRRTSPRSGPGSSLDDISLDLQARGQLAFLYGQVARQDRELLIVSHRLSCELSSSMSV